MSPCPHLLSEHTQFTIPHMITIQGSFIILVAIL